MPTLQAAGPVEVGEVTVPCGPRAPFLARLAVSRWLHSQPYGEVLDDACLLVSELVTNSVKHAGQPEGAPVHIRAAAVNGVVRVEVHDCGHGPVRPRAPAHRQAGFGLRLVEQLATRWGVNDEHGTRVWFELAARSGGP
jgi:anti-sigma regulatory factor (Ser/Thr protein kinase)